LLQTTDLFLLTADCYSYWGGGPLGLRPRAPGIRRLH